MRTVPATKAERPLTVQSRDVRGDAGQRARRAVSRPSDRPLLAGFGHGGHSLFIGGQPLVSHLDFDGEFCDDA